MSGGHYKFGEPPTCLTPQYIYTPLNDSLLSRSNQAKNEANKAGKEYECVRSTGIQSGISKAKKIDIKV